MAWEVRPGLFMPKTWVRILEVPFYILSPFTRVGKVNIWNEHLDSGDPSSGGGGGRDLAQRSEGPGIESRRGQWTLRAEKRAVDPSPIALP